MINTHSPSYGASSLVDKAPRLIARGTEIETRKEEEKNRSSARFRAVPRGSARFRAVPRGSVSHHSFALHHYLIYGAKTYQGIIIQQSLACIIYYTHYY